MNDFDGGTDDDYGDERVRAAFDRLSLDARRVDPMVALHRVERARGGARPGIGSVVVAAAAVAIIAGVAIAFVATRGDDPVDIATGEAFQTPAATSQQTIGSLTETAWTLRSGFGPDGDIPVPEGWPVTIRFGDLEFGGTAACNGYGGRYELNGDTITFEELGQNEMHCAGNGDADPMLSEARYLAALQAVDRIRMDGEQLRLSGPSTEMTFDLATPVPESELVDHVWLLDTLIDGGTASSVGGDRATLLLRGDATVAGSTGCRDFTGEYAVAGASVLFTSLAMSGDCGAELADQDGHVVTVLGDGFSAMITDDRLTLSSQGDLGLGYTAINGVSTFAPSPPGAAGPDVMSAGELLDSGRVGPPILVQAQLLYRGGSWILCDRIEADPTPRCVDRWIVVTNYDQTVDPHTEPPTSIDEAAFGLAQASDDFVASGDAVYTPEAQQVLVEGLQDGRYAVPGWPSLADGTLTQSQLLGRLTEFAVVGDATAIGEIPFADEVLLGLSDQVLVTRSPSELADPAAWQLDAEAFRGRVGPFSALDLLSPGGPRQVVVGRHDHCASPPAPIAERLRDASHVSIQPLEVDGCLEWWTIDVFFDETGAIIGVMLDLWEP